MKETLRKNRFSSIPLYFRVESLLRNKILNGQWEPGEKLPTEGALVKQFGVSIITIRRALSNLEQEGLIVRNRAIGTYVTDNIKLTSKFVITNEVYNILQDAGQYEVRDISLEEIKLKDARNAAELREFFTLTNKDKISVLKRTRLLHGNPIYYLENYMPIEIAKNLSTKELEKKPLLNILKEKIHLTIDHGVMYIEAIPADIDVAEILKTQIFEPLMLRQLRYWIQGGKPLQIVDAFMRQDYFKYKVNIAETSF